MLLRVITAAVLLPVLWVAIKMAPPPVFSVLALTFIGAACWECYRMVQRDGIRPFAWLGVAAGLAVVWSFLGFQPRYGAELPLVWLTVLTLVLAMWKGSSPNQMLQTTVVTLFPALFVGLGLAYLVGLRGMPGNDGEDLLMLLFVCVIFADTAAFIFGKAFGKHAMAPVISPNKSWEGALAGVAGSVLAALIAHFWFYQRLALPHALLLGAVLGMAAILGDLAESMVKRSAGVKDSSNLLPGHGGVLDRMDSLLFAGPLLYYYYRWFLQAGA
jgi:phosphatidate cytidylyltransferase